MDKEEDIQESSTRNLTHLRKGDFCLEREGADPALQKAMDEGPEKQQGQNRGCLLHSFRLTLHPEGPPLREAPWSSPEAVVEGGTVESFFHQWEPLTEFFKHFPCSRAGVHFRQDAPDTLPCPSRDKAHFNQRWDT